MQSSNIKLKTRSFKAIILTRGWAEEMAKLTAAIVFVLEIHLSAAASARKPHIVLIVADDLVLPLK